jgi:DNA-binding response OmpR family regulator
MTNKTILLSDPDTAVAAYMAEVLSAAGYTVLRNSEQRLTVDAIECVRPGLVIAGCRSARTDAAELLGQLWAAGAPRQYSLIVSTTDPQTKRDLAAPLQRQGCDILLKPFDLDELLESVAGAFHQRCRPAV